MADPVGQCTPQGRLQLDKPHALASPQSSFPFCKEFQGCSCCNSSHVLTIRNDILHLGLDESMSRECLQDVEAHSCAVCDPWIGTGGVRQYPQSFCDSWHGHCKRAFVTINPVTGLLDWCSEASNALICGRLDEFASNGTTLCSLVGAEAVAEPERDSTSPAAGRRRPRFPTGAPDERGARICQDNAGIRAHMHAASRAARDTGTDAATSGLMLSQGDLMEMLISVVGIMVALSVLGVVTAKRFATRRRSQLGFGPEGFAGGLWGAAPRRTAADMRADMLLAAELRQEAQIRRELREGDTRAAAADAADAASDDSE
eukprot:jgi/Ulvmu1/1637/UM114_0003.1